MTIEHGIPKSSEQQDAALVAQVHENYRLITERIHSFCSITLKAAQRQYPNGAQYGYNIDWFFGPLNHQLEHSRKSLEEQDVLLSLFFERRKEIFLDLAKVCTRDELSQMCQIVEEILRFHSSLSVAHFALQGKETRFAVWSVEKNKDQLEATIDILFYLNLSREILKKIK